MPRSFFLLCVALVLTACGGTRALAPADGAGGAGGSGTDANAAGASGGAIPPTPPADAAPPQPRPAPDAAPPPRPAPDAGPIAPCAPPRLVCDGICVDPATDVNHCGGCGRGCGSLRNAEGVRCQAGACGYQRCIGERTRPTLLPDGTWNSFLDCDGNRSNGCEAQRSPTTCTCSRTCQAPDVCQWDQSDDRWICD